MSVPRAAPGDPRATAASATPPLPLATADYPRLASPLLPLLASPAAPPSFAPLGATVPLPRRPRSGLLPHCPSPAARVGDKQPRPSAPAADGPGHPQPSSAPVGRSPVSP